MPLIRVSGLEPYPPNWRSAMRDKIAERVADISRLGLTPEKIGFSFPIEGGASGERRVYIFVEALLTKDRTDQDLKELVETIRDVVADEVTTHQVDNVTYVLATATTKIGTATAVWRQEERDKREEAIFEAA